MWHWLASPLASHLLLPAAPVGNLTSTIRLIVCDVWSRSAEEEDDEEEEEEPTKQY